MHARSSHLLDPPTGGDFASRDLGDERSGAATPRGAPGSSDYTSESVLERGVWRERAAASTAGSVTDQSPFASLEWTPAPTLRQRIVRAISVPALAGTCVFVATVVIAIIMTMQQFTPRGDSGSGEASELSASSVEGGVAPGGGNSSMPSAEQGIADGDPASRATEPAPSQVTVHVVGAVKRPGVVQVPAQTRVGAAIEAAGGATMAAKLEAVNLARVVVDGEQILVPDETSVGVPSAGAGASGNAPGAPPTQLINLNSADLATLESLPNIGPALAQRIIDWRTENGRFTSTDQLLDVAGVGEKTFAALEAQVTV